MRVPVWVFSVAVGAAVAAGLPSARARAEAIAADKLPEPALSSPIAAGKARSPVYEPSGREVAAYLRQVHERVHQRWAGNFLRLAAEQLPASNPVNVAGRTALADVIITGDGRLLSVTLTESGGFPGFDDAVTEVLHDAAPFPEAPLEARSDDNAVHLRWRFARDQRRCAEVAIVSVEDPLAQAIPRLLRDARAGGAGVEPMMSTVAGYWLKATMNAPYATVRSAEALAALGDGAGVRWLQLAVRRPEWAAAAGEALAAHHVPICPIVGSAFDAANRNQNPAEQQMAAVALATAGEAAC